MPSLAFHGVCSKAQIVGVVTESFRIRHCGQSENAPVVCFFHFLFVTVVKGFLAISAAAGGGEEKNQYLECNVWPMQ